MSNYLELMDELKDTYIKEHTGQPNVKYSLAQYRYYEAIEYNVPQDVWFEQQLVAAKIIKTTILFWNPETNIKVYLSDEDINTMIKAMPDDDLKAHIISSIQKMLDKTQSDTVTFKIRENSYKVKGIVFDSRFNEILCKNPADIRMNGNDLIALINLIIEKERFDRNHKKWMKTAAFYINKSSP